MGLQVTIIGYKDEGLREGNEDLQEEFAMTELRVLKGSPLDVMPGWRP